jgi:hypothetical protein
MGPTLTRKCLNFFYNLASSKKVNSALTESTQNDEYFEYFIFLLGTNLGLESGDKVEYFDEDTRDKKSFMQVYL